MTKPSTTSSTTDTIVGMSLNGSLYVLDHPYNMAPDANDLNPSARCMDNDEMME